MQSSETLFFHVAAAAAAGTTAAAAQERAQFGAFGRRTAKSKVAPVQGGDDKFYMAEGDR